MSDLILRRFPMNWRKLARELILGDGTINAREAQLLRREILADHQVDRAEAEFLIDLKRSARAVHPDFDHLVGQVLKRLVLRDGVVADSEALWLRRLLLADDRISAEEAKFLEELRGEARAVGKEFEALCQESKRVRELSRW
jgi:hypothetical protein